MNFPRKRTRTGTLLGLGVVALILVFAACSNYAEGERCQSANGDDDCQSGLVCTPAAQLTNTQSDRCCPADRTTASEPVCKVPTSVPGTSNDAAAGADTGLGTADAGSTDASDAADAPADG